MAEDVRDVNHAHRHYKPILYYGLVASLFLFVLLIYLLFIELEVYTDDAYVEGNQIFITPLMKGFVQAIHTDETFLVNEGDLLVELDTTDARIALDSARNQLGDAVRHISALFHSLEALKADIEIKQAEWIKAKQDLEHREGLIRSGSVSLEDLQHAQAAFAASLAALAMTESLYKETEALIHNTTVRTHPEVLAKIDLFRQSFVDLFRCRILSPATGLVAQRKIQVGMWVNPGEPLMSVIPLDQIWVNANFKETQMNRMRIGQKVHITSDLYGSSVAFSGEVVGLPGAAGNAFSLLPPQNLSGNWIKIVQRLPVRVKLELSELKAHPLRIGLSMYATVNTQSTTGPLVPSSSQGAPHYQTTIFQNEEKGALAEALRIVEENIDPRLVAHGK